MALQDKYSDLMSVVNQQGTTNLQVREQDNVLYIDGSVNSKEAKEEIWAAYEKIDPGFRSADVVLNITAPDTDLEQKTVSYTVVSGDSLSKIAARHGITWQKIYEINQDVIKNPDLIKVGMSIKIPLV